MDLQKILFNQRAEIEALDISKLCTRVEEQQIDLDSKLAQIVIGVRRSGKSTLCQKVLLQNNIKYAYVNFDDENLVDIKKSDLDTLLENLYRVYGEFTHLFLDEIQNIEGWHLFVNRLLRLGIRLIITGSNANLLSGELATHLTGRYNQIELYPFSFLEYCTINNIKVAGKTTKDEALRLRALDEYLFRGGFPEIIGLENSRKYTLSLLNAIINKDICQRYKVRHKQTLSDIANGLLDLFCQEISYAQIAKTYQLNSIHTAKNYYSYLVNAYLLCAIPKYSFKSRERQQMRKSYAIDPAFITNHEVVLQPDNYGWRLENVVAIELLRRLDSSYQQLFYLRQNKSYEVDFVVVEQSKIKELIQVTYDFSAPTTKLYNREVGGLVKGAKQTGCHQLTLIMMNGESRTLEVDGYTIKCIRAVDWLLNKE